MSIIQLGSSRPTDAGLPLDIQPIHIYGVTDHFTCIFQSISRIFPPYEQQIFVHNKSSLQFLGKSDLSIHNANICQIPIQKIISLPPAAFCATAMTSCANSLLQWTATPAFVAAVKQGNVGNRQKPFILLDVSVPSE